MAITVKHAKTSAVADVGDSSLVQPSDWNADHALTGLGGAAELDVGTTAGTVAAGDHTHSGVYEPVDATILKDADIGVTVQALLTSGTNIKTINGSSILGSGNIEVSGGGGVTVGFEQNFLLMGA